MELKSSGSEGICGNFDVMERILGFLHERREVDDNPSSPSDSSKKDLFSACLVSKSFLEPALTILWRHLNSLMPVLRLFPMFEKNERSGNWSLTGTICNDHLQRLLYYSRRIRSIRITSPPDLLTTNALAVLSYRMQPLQPFLPLTELFVEISRDNNVLDSFLFIMPLTLTTVSISGLSSAASCIAVASFLQHLSSDSLLKSLCLNGSISPALFATVLECTSLRSLTLNSNDIVFTADTLEQLSEALTSLETLDLYRLRGGGVPGSHRIPTSTSRDFLPKVIFPSLLELILIGDLVTITGSLSIMNAPKLREITLIIMTRVTDDLPVNAATFVTCMAQVPKINGLEGKGSLRAVKIKLTNRYTCIDLSAFDALSEFRATLQVLHLQPNRLQLDLLQPQREYKNPILTNLVYPNLVDLRLPFRLNSTSTYYTIRALEGLARSCPNLKTLHISIGNSLSKYIEEKSKEIERFNAIRFPAHHHGHGLQTLVFHHLPQNWDFSISLAVVLARYLNKIFPKLSSAEYCEEGISEAVQEWWTGVQDMLKMCQGREMLDGCL